ncbi:MAG: LysM peptidoglycan-binding domain-containing protein [Clostridia bacterium]|nr:LysM peptidoglycan-binding domain-containing protein [Clostridia bacterium]
MLKLLERKWYQVKRGQTLQEIAAGLNTTAYALAAENNLKEEVREGQLLRVPQARPLYTVQAGDNKALLCGSDQAYRERNGTQAFYPGMRVRL